MVSVSIRTGFLLAVLATGQLGAQAASLTVAVASNFAAPMEALATAFERSSGHQLRLVFGSSGRFHAQIANGAPFDVFFSADQSKPEALVRAGLARADSRFTYAIGSLVLWSRDPALIDANAAVLHEGRFERLAIANPRLAPYGLAATQTLESLGLLATLESKLVQGENIAQAYQFIYTGNANLGFVARSQLTGETVFTGGSAWPVPADLHDPIRQDAVILNRAIELQAARDFLDFLRSDAGSTIIEAFGYRAGNGDE